MVYNPNQDVSGETVQIRCGKCRSVADFTVYRHIDVTGKPQLKKAVVEGTLFSHRCRNCGVSGRVPYSFIYSDHMASLYVKVFTNRQEALEAEDSKSQMDIGGWDELGKMEGEHDVRVSVAGVEELVEMIRIVDSRLNPYFVMGSKKILLAQTKLDPKTSIYFEGLIPDAGVSLKFWYNDVHGKHRTMTMFKSAYDMIAKQMNEYDFEPLRLAELIDSESVTELFERCASADPLPSKNFWQLKKAAKGKNGSAWMELGAAYYNGNGIKQNYFKAFKCFREGAEAGDAQAQSALAMCFIHGFGVSPSAVRAEAWYRSAAEQGNADGLFGMGLLAHYGTRFKKINYHEAAQFYEKAIRAGHDRANYMLGLLYEEGKGVVRNLPKSRDLFARAVGMDVTDAIEAFKRVSTRLNEHPGQESNQILQIPSPLDEEEFEDIPPPPAMSPPSEPKENSRSGIHPQGSIFEILCPKCGEALELPRAAIGHSVQCPFCGTKFVGEEPIVLKAVRRNKEQVETTRRAGTMKTIVLPGGACLDLVWCPPGTFMMGNEIRHRVTLTKGFWIGQYEVSQIQWRSVMGDNPSQFKGEYLPIDSISWEMCQLFLHKAGLGLRLPTEAEWEYARRAGNPDEYLVEEQMNELYRKLGSDEQPMGIRGANTWGIFDMDGNMREWCQDYYGDYPNESVIDPIGAETGETHVIRWGMRRQGYRVFNAHLLVPTPQKGYGYRSDRAFSFRVCCSGAL